jgi:nicotinamide riboside transporter PnuC
MSRALLLLIVLAVAATAVGLFLWKRAADRRKRRLARRARQAEQQEAWDRAMAERRSED